MNLHLCRYGRRTLDEAIFCIFPSTSTGWRRCGTFFDGLIWPVPCDIYMGMAISWHRSETGIFILISLVSSLVFFSFAAKNVSACFFSFSSFSPFSSWQSPQSSDQRFLNQNRIGSSPDF